MEADKTSAEMMDEQERLFQYAECHHDTAMRHQKSNPKCDCRRCHGAQPRPLPLGQNVDGRHVWEPPIFDYSALIGEEYEKMREAAMKYTKRNRARTTALMDVTTESLLLHDYLCWLSYHSDGHDLSGDSERNGFYDVLRQEVEIESNELLQAYDEMGLHIQKNDEGQWEVSSEPPEMFWEIGGEEGFKDESFFTPDTAQISSCAVETEELQQLDSGPSEKEDGDKTKTLNLNKMPPNAYPESEACKPNSDEIPEPLEDANDEARPNDLLSLWW